MHDSSLSQVPENPVEARRWVEQCLDERAGHLRTEPSAGFAERVLERIDAGPLEGAPRELYRRPARPHLRWIAVAAGLLVAASLLFLSKPWASRLRQRPASVLGVTEGALGLGVAERMLTEEWEAILADARSMLVAVGTSLPH